MESFYMFVVGAVFPFILVTCLYAVYKSLVNDRFYSAADKVALGILYSILALLVAFVLSFLWIGVIVIFVMYYIFRKNEEKIDKFYSDLILKINP